MEWEMQKGPSGAVKKSVDNWHISARPAQIEAQLCHTVVWNLRQMM